MPWDPDPGGTGSSFGVGTMLACLVGSIGQSGQLLGGFVVDYFWVTLYQLTKLEVDCLVFARWEEDGR